MPRLIRSVARTAAVAGTATAVSGRVAHRQAGRWAAQEAAASPQQTYAPPPAAPAPPVAPAAPAAPAPDISAQLAQLKQLGELKDQGLLTEAEFAAQKQRILST